MQITHEEARTLIHLASDGTLTAHEKAILDFHLASCTECSHYAEDTRNMETILRPLLERQWSRQPIPLSIDTLVSTGSSKMLNSNILLATRIAAIGVIFVMFMFTAWQFALSKSESSAPMMPASLQPIPIPSTSTQLVSPKTQSGACEKVTYVVQANDTLASIAFRFSTSKKEIMITNNMKSEIIIRNMLITIPVCNFTPTGTVNASTYTPSTRTITSTPGG